MLLQIDQQSFSICLNYGFLLFESITFYAHSYIYQETTDWLFTFGRIDHNAML